jgi:hypothetical protein
MAGETKDDLLSAESGAILGLQPGALRARGGALRAGGLASIALDLLPSETGLRGRRRAKKGRERTYSSHRLSRPAFAGAGWASDRRRGEGCRRRCVSSWIGGGRRRPWPWWRVTGDVVVALGVADGHVDAFHLGIEIEIDGGLSNVQVGGGLSYCGSESYVIYLSSLVSDSRPCLSDFRPCLNYDDDDHVSNFKAVAGSRVIPNLIFPPWLQSTLPLRRQPTRPKTSSMMETRQSPRYVPSVQLPTALLTSLLKEILLMKQRVEEMEREAKKLREMQAAAAEETESAEDPAAEGDEDKSAADGRSIYVGNVRLFFTFRYPRSTFHPTQVDYASTPEEIQAHFAACGTINRVTILCDKFTGHPKGSVASTVHPITS